MRERSEWDEGHIPGFVFKPSNDIDALPEGLDPARPIAVVCGSGQRAAVAAKPGLARGRARGDPRGRRRRPEVGPPGQRARDGGLGEASSSGNGCQNRVAPSP